MPEATTRTHFNGHSMVHALERVMVCPPRTAGWNRPKVATRWQELGFHHALNFATAQSQHDALCHELRTAGAEIVDMPPAPDLSLDAVYAHDASLPVSYTHLDVYKRQVVIRLRRSLGLRLVLGGGGWDNE